MLASVSSPDGLGTIPAALAPPYWSVEPSYTQKSFGIHAVPMAAPDVTAEHNCLHTNHRGVVYGTWHSCSHYDDYMVCIQVQSSMSSHKAPQHYTPKQDTYSRPVLIGLIYSRPPLIEIMSAYNIETGSCADLSSKPRAHMLTARAAASYDKTPSLIKP